MGRQGCYIPLLTLFDSEKTHQNTRPKGRRKWGYSSTGRATALQAEDRGSSPRFSTNLMCPNGGMADAAGLDPVTSVWGFKSLFGYQHILVAERQTLEAQTLLPKGVSVQVRSGIPTPCGIPHKISTRAEFRSYGWLSRKILGNGNGLENRGSLKALWGFESTRHPPIQHPLTPRG